MTEFDATTTGPAGEIEAGTRLGAYRVIREIGRGGSGQVFLAERDDGQFRQSVAIKLLKRGMDTDAVLQRFRNERQILATLDHPHIARVIDGGAVPDGRPFLVMEYIDGVAITEYCRMHALSLQGRIELLLPLCDAVQHAHQRLLIHRDIKPSNVLVTAAGVPKLLDFGIAKLLVPGSLDGAGTVHTAEFHPLLTPGYASPEQVLGEPITTGTDVYGLGLLLRELLTGLPARTSGMETVAALRATCESDLASPSSVLRAKAPDGHPISAAALVGDLDNIVAMATAREPARRYASVEQLAVDLRRHLAHKPVNARPTTWSYAAGRFIRRNRLAVAAATVAVVGLAVGLGVALWQAHEARLARAAAEHRFGELRQLTNSLVFNYHDAIKELPGSTEVRAELLRDGIEVLDSLAADAADNRGLALELSDAYQRIAVLQGMEFVSNTGDTEGALTSSQKGLALLDALSAETSRDAGLLYQWGEGLAEQASLRQALGQTEQARDDLLRAERALATATAIEPTRDGRERLAMTYKRLAEVLGGSANTANLGRKQESLRYQLRALEIRKALVAEWPADLEYKNLLAQTYHSIGEWHYNAADLPHAIENAQAALAMRRELVAADGLNQQFRRELAIGISSNGTLLLTNDDAAGALALDEEALPLYEVLARDDAANQNAKRDLVLGWRDVGTGLYQTGQADRGRPYFDRAYPRLQEFIAADPASFYNQRQLINTHLKHAAGALRCELSHEHAAHARAALAAAEKLLQEFPENPVALSSLATARLESARALEATRPAEAIHLYEASLAGWRQLEHAGTLRGLDAKRPAEVEAAIARLTAG
ncbi:MAG: protein kinase domain-containing protein [Steroidobacteraceae bacterium]